MKIDFIESSSDAKVAFEFYQTRIVPINIEIHRSNIEIDRLENTFLFGRDFKKLNKLKNKIAFLNAALGAFEQQFNNLVQAAGNSLKSGENK